MSHQYHTKTEDSTRHRHGTESERVTEADKRVPWLRGLDSENGRQVQEGEILGLFESGVVGGAQDLLDFRGGP